MRDDEPRPVWMSLPRQEAEGKPPNLHEACSGKRLGRDWALNPNLKLGFAELAA
jgi:hypothetical protein